MSHCKLQVASALQLTVLVKQRRQRGVKPDSCTLSKSVVTSIFLKTGKLHNPRTYSIYFDRRPSRRKPHRKKHVLEWTTCMPYAPHVCMCDVSSAQERNDLDFGYMTCRYHLTSKVCLPGLFVIQRLYGKLFPSNKTRRIRVNLSECFWAIQKGGGWAWSKSEYHSVRIP